MILLIDDDDEVRRLLADGLRRQGLRVMAAEDESDAVRRARHETPDLILLELGMTPPAEAMGAGRRVRADAGLPPEVPLVVYAGGEDATVREGEEVETGPAEYVVLPEGSEQLVRFLRRLAA